MGAYFLQPVQLTLFGYDGLTGICVMLARPSPQVSIRVWWEGKTKLFGKWMENEQMQIQLFRVLWVVSNKLLSF